MLILFKEVVAAVVLGSIVSKTLAASSFTQDTCNNLDRCSSNSFSVSRLIELSVLLKESKTSSGNFSLDSLACIKKTIEYFLMDLNQNLLVETELLVAERSTVEEGMCPYNSSAPSDEFFRLFKEKRNSLFDILSGRFAKIRRDSNYMDNLDESVITENCLNYLEVVHKKESSRSLRSSRLEIADYVLKKLFYERIIRDICLDTVHTLYERVVIVIDYLIENEPDLFKTEVDDDALTLIRFVRENSAVKEAYIETYLCRYARATIATVYSDHEKSRLILSLNSLEPLDEIVTFIAAANGKAY